MRPEQSSGVGPQAGPKWEGLLFWALVLVHVGYVWLFHWFPTQDGPSHVDNAAILLKLLLGRDSLVHEYYALNLSTYTNWLGSLVLAGLMTFLDGFTAEKVLLSGYLALLPISFRYALGGLGPGAGRYVFFIFPLLYSRLFFMGFHSFCYSLAFFFLMLGYWLRRREGMRPIQTAVLMVLGIVTLFWHIFSLVLAGLVMAVTALEGPLQEYLAGFRAGKRGLGRLIRQGAARLIRPALILLPSVVLIAAFLSRGGGQISYRDGPLRLLGHLAAGTIMMNLGWWELILSAGFMLVLGLAWWQGFWERRKGGQGGGLGLGLLFGTVLVLYLAMPNAYAGGSVISYRLALFATFAAVLAAAAQAPVRPRKALCLAPVAISLLLLIFRFQPVHDLNGYLDDYLSGADSLARGRTIVPISFLGTELHPLDSKLAWRVRFFVHAGGYLAQARDCVNLRNYEAMLDYFPVRYQKEKNPLQHLVVDRDILALPPRLDFSGYPARSGGRADYVLLWCYDPKVNQEPASRSIMSQLRSDYREVFVSPRGLMRIHGRDQGGGQ